MKSKSQITLLAFILLTLTFTKNSQAQHKEFEEWKELKAFHEVISHTFHPMEEGNFKPIREKSGELNAAAQKLADSKIPADLKTKEVVAAVKELTVKTKEVDNLVKSKASDKEVQASLTAVHDSFHKIVGLCSKDDHENSKEGHEHEGHDQPKK